MRDGGGFRDAVGTHSYSRSGTQVNSLDEQLATFYKIKYKVIIKATVLVASVAKRGRGRSAAGQAKKRRARLQAE